MAQTLSVSHQKGDISSWHSQKASGSDALAEGPPPLATAAAGDSGVGGCCIKSPISSIQSSSQRSQHSESKWTSFDESEQEDSSLERRHSESEHLGLLPHVEDIVSEGDDMCDDSSFVITDQLRDYYVLCFSKLLEQTQGFADLGAALCGQDAKVFEFFLKSNLPKEELGKIWKLSDVNEDGFLNLDEFCVAMHLIVRRVKANLEIPFYLPDCLVPAKTPPRNVTPVSCRGEVGWVNFEVDAGDRAASCAAAPDSPSLKEFTSSLTAEQGSQLACPIACHISPEMVESRNREQEAQSRLASNLNDRAPVAVLSGSAAAAMSSSSSSAKSGGDSRVFSGGSSSATSRAKVISPQAPKGPPPKPPPRPVTRHVRSASLDLTKQAHASQPPPAGPAPQLRAETATTTSDDSTTKKRLMETGVQTEPVRFEKTSAAGSSPSSAQQQPMLDFGVDFNDELFNTLAGIGGGDTLRMFSRGPKEERLPATSAAHSGAGVGAKGAVAVMAREGKDWRRYCHQLTQLNVELEREYKQLMEVRLGLENTLKSVQHG